MTKTILHISNDFPDPLQSRKTKAIQNLIDATPEYRHIVYSLNRVTSFSGISSMPFGVDRTAIAYGALPKGLFWESRMSAVAKWIIKDLTDKNITPDLIEAHKLTIEGLTGEEISDHYHIPLICDIQGNTDVKIIKNKPDMRRRYQRIAKKCPVIFPFSPWVIAPFVNLAAMDQNKCINLPVLTEQDNLSAAPVTGNSRLVTIFNLDIAKLKNLHGLLAAIKKLVVKIPDISLDIYGQGSAKSLISINKDIKKLGLTDHIHILGPIPNHQIHDKLKEYAAFVMPTLSESYGLVHVESLFSGLPILYSKGRGIDGYLPAHKVGYACSPDNVDDIAAGIEHLLTNEARIKASITELQQTGGLDHLRREKIVAAYRRGINLALENGAIK